MKRKVTTISLILALLAICVIGTSLAYFTDTDKAENVFTSGKVDIKLEEVFEDGSKLLPAVIDPDGTVHNAVTKEVKVKAESTSEDVFVRVHIAVPKVVAAGADPAEDNLLHLSWASTSVGSGKWNWSKSVGSPYTGNWNSYETTVDGIDYVVYVVTWETALKAGEETSEKAIEKVYLDSSVTNEKVDEINDALGENWKILVVAEGAQAAGFGDAYQALNTAFGNPGSYDPFN